MHRTCRLICQKSEGIPLVTSRSIKPKTPHSTTTSGISGRSVFIFADKNGVVVVGTFINRAVRNTLLYERIVDATPKKILSHSIAVLILGRQKQHLWLVFLGSRDRGLPVCQHLPCEDFHGFHKTVLFDFHQIVKGRIAAEAPRPPVPFAVGNLQAVVFCGAVHIGRAFDLDEIARFIGSQIGKQIYLSYPFQHIRVNLHIGSVTSHSVKSPPEIEKAEGLIVG